MYDLTTLLKFAPPNVLNWLFNLTNSKSFYEMLIKINSDYIVSQDLNIQSIITVTPINIYNATYHIDLYKDKIYQERNTLWQIILI